MPRTIRFHLDENSSRAIAGGLRRCSVDVTTTPEVGLMGATDKQQAAYGQAEGRVLFTQDQDFLRLDAAGVPHAGIAYCVKDTKSIGEIIQSLVLIWEVYEPEEMTGRVEYLSAFDTRFALPPSIARHDDAERWPRPIVLTIRPARSAGDAGTGVL